MIPYEDSYSMPAVALERPPRSRRRALILLAAVGVALYMTTALATDTTKLLSALRQLGWIGCTLVLALSCVNYFLRFFRWQRYLVKLGHPLPMFRHLLWYLSGFAFTVSPGKAGEAMRAFYLHEQGVPHSETIATLFVERLLDVLAMVVLASLIVLVTDAYVWLLVAAGLATLLLIFLVCRPSLPDRLARFSTRHTRYQKWLALMARLLRSSQNLLKPELLAVGLLIGLLAWGAESLGFYLICRSLSLTVTIGVATGIYAVAALAGAAAIILPAGIGGTEIVMTTLLVARGASFPEAVVATLLCRLATLWLAVLIGLLATGFLESSHALRRLKTAP
jgi:uncharacterized protein (TIRG00374 family)